MLRGGGKEADKVDKRERERERGRTKRTAAVRGEGGLRGRFDERSKIVPVDNIADSALSVEEKLGTNTVYSTGNGEEQGRSSHVGSSVHDGSKSSRLECKGISESSWKGILRQFLVAARLRPEKQLTEVRQGVLVDDRVLASSQGQLGPGGSSIGGVRKTLGFCALHLHRRSSEGSCECARVDDSREVVVALVNHGSCEAGKKIKLASTRYSLIEKGAERGEDLAHHRILL